MPDHLDGNEAQSRMIARQLFSVWTEEQGQVKEPPKPIELPAPLKWAAGIVAALSTAAAGGMALWLVTTVNEMQLTLARMDERMANSTTNAVGRIDNIELRLRELETGEREEQ